MTLFNKMIVLMLDKQLPLTVTDLAEMLGKNRDVVDNAMRILHKVKQVHITDYVPGKNGRLSARWRVGRNVDASKPNVYEVLMQEIKKERK